MTLAPLTSLGLVRHNPIYSLRRANVVIQSSEGSAHAKRNHSRSRRTPDVSTSNPPRQGILTTLSPTLTAEISPKLLQEPYIALEKILQIVHPILQQREPVDAHAEGKS